jgi:hypothetical protein
MVVGYFLVVLLVGISVHILLGHELHWIQHIQRFLKILFPILGFGAIVYLDRKFPRSRDARFLWQTASLYGLVAASSIILFYFLGVGLRTYTTGFSSKGFFGSQNSIGFLLVASLSCSLYYIFTYRRNNLLWIIGVEAIFLFSALLVGTRAAIIGVPATIMAFHAFTFFQRGYGQRMPPLLYNLIFIAGLSAVGYLVYSLWASQDIRYIIYKFELVFNSGGFAYGTDHLRAKVPLGLQLISEFRVSEHLFGIGDTAFLLTENDFVDVYGKFGLLTLVPLLLFFSVWYLTAVWIFVTRRSLSSFVLLLPMTYYVVHAAIAGHAFTIAQSNNLLMLLYYLIYQQTGLSHKYDTNKVELAQLQIVAASVHWATYSSKES